METGRTRPLETEAKAGWAMAGREQRMKRDRKCGWAKAEGEEGWRDSGERGPAGLASAHCQVGASPAPAISTAPSQLQAWFPEGAHLGTVSHLISLLARWVPCLPLPGLASVTLKALSLGIAV